MLTYDEEHLSSQVATLSTKQRSYFAALCAERLTSLGESFFGQLEESSLEKYKSVMRTIWQPLLGAPTTEGELVNAQAAAEEIIPDEEDESWDERAAYGQSAAIAAAYAARTATTGEARDAVLAARHVYEAADYAAQQLIDVDLNSTDAEHDLMSTSVVQYALSGIQEDLVSAGVEEADLSTVAPQARERAGAAGIELARLAEQP